MKTEYNKWSAMNKPTMGHTISRLVVYLCVALFITAAFLFFSHLKMQALQRTATMTQVRTLAKHYDADTDEQGIYRNSISRELDAIDSWGNPIVINYAMGGVMQILEVRSPGPDGIAHTSDDIHATCQSTNLKGIGTGIRENIEETAKNATKGVVAGIRESSGNPHKNDP